MNRWDQMGDALKPLQDVFSPSLVCHGSEYGVRPYGVGGIEIIAMRHAWNAELEFSNSIVVHKPQRSCGPRNIAPRVIYMLEVMDDFLGSRGSEAEWR